ncbi:unnamed protein product [Hermetia illucens]|uniref:Lipase n=1 Tax=Hermetia illucens TaxID=343691 RepID=A0A7R8ULF0_HERIL|nr:lipase 3-like isoform X1 [Hermetia illucens]CAD7082804.1 unnamed protein product [Hermetia illucens]
MFRFLCLLLLTQLVVGNVPASYLRDEFDDLDVDDLYDENYDEEAEIAKQDTVDERIKAAIVKSTRDAGYPLETHSVVTDDGYILTVHRIPYAKSNRDVKNKPVVFLQHGLLSCSLHYTTQGPGVAIAYLLAEEGYDVWLGNARGNSFSKDHVKLDPKKKDFWNFSWHEIGYYDLPAMIDYVLRNTGVSALNYVGHSQGTTSFFVMTSLRPEYNAKIKAMHALAPVAFMGNMDNPLMKILGPIVSKGTLLTNLIGSFEFMPSTKLMGTIGKVFCKDGSIVQGICSSVLFMIAGFSNENLNTTMLPEILQTTPAGASVNQLIHYAQEYVSYRFRQFDLGAIKNLLAYKFPTPPDYLLTKITAPIHLYYAGNDWLTSVKDVKTLASKLRNVVYNKQVPHPKFNHFDFLWGLQVYDLVYSDLIANIKKYT